MNFVIVLTFKSKYGLAGHQKVHKEGYQEKLDAYQESKKLLLRNKKKPKPAKFINNKYTKIYMAIIEDARINPKSGAINGYRAHYSEVTTRHVSINTLTAIINRPNS